MDGLGKFTTTRWAVVLEASGDGEQSTAAKELLCRQYWQPLYCFLRRSGHSEEDAQDLTQTFLARLLSGTALQKSDPSDGRLRTYLIRMLKNFTADVRRYEHRQKRTPSEPLFSLDGSPEVDFNTSAVDRSTPEQAYDRRWAVLIIERAFSTLEAEYRKRGRLDLFRRLKSYLHDDPEATPHQETAEVLGLTVSAVKSELTRMRQQLREAIRDEIRPTVEGELDIDEEFRSLTAILSN